MFEIQNKKSRKVSFFNFFNFFDVDVLVADVPDCWSMKNRTFLLLLSLLLLQLPCFLDMFLPIFMIAMTRILGRKQLLKYVDLWKLVSSSCFSYCKRESQRFIDALETKMKKTWLLQSTRKHHLPSAASSPPSSTGPKLRLINEANQFCQSDSTRTFTAFNFL